MGFHLIIICFTLMNGSPFLLGIKEINIVLRFCLVHEACNALRIDRAGELI